MEVNCWKMNSCEDCPECCPCLWYNRMLYFITHSLLPKKRLFSEKLKVINCDDYARLMNIKKHITSFVDEGKNLVLTIKDKTNEPIEYGIKLLLSYFNQVAYSEYEMKGLFIDMPLYIDKIKDNIKIPDADLVELKKYINKVDLVVFYNYGAMSDYISGVVQSNIETRSNNKLTSIFIKGDTANENSDSILKKLDRVELSI
jgi:hypothetical protein